MSEKKTLTALTAARLPEADRQNAKRFCPKCGREIPLDRQICDFCANTGEIPRPRASLRKKLVLLALLLIGAVLLVFWVKGFSLPRVRTGVEIISTASPQPKGTSLPVIMLDNDK